MTSERAPVMIQPEESEIQQPVEESVAPKPVLGQLASSFWAEAHMESVRAKHAQTDDLKRQHGERAAELRRLARAAEDAEIISSWYRQEANTTSKILLCQTVRLFRRLLVRASVGIPGPQNEEQFLSYRNAVDLVTAVDEALETGNWALVDEARKALPRRSLRRSDQIKDLKAGVVRAIVEAGCPLPMDAVASLVGGFCTSLRGFRDQAANEQRIRETFASGQELDIKKLFASWEKLKVDDQDLLEKFEQFVRSLIVCAIRAVIEDQRAELLGVNEIRFLFDAKQNGGGRLRPDRKTGHAESCTASLDEVRALCVSSREFSFLNATKKGPV